MDKWLVGIVATIYAENAMTTQRASITSLRRFARCQWLAGLILCTGLIQPGQAMNLVRTETRTDLAVSTFGVDGSGVTIAIIDRGIDWQHPDFIKPDGSTRIRAMLDMSGQNGCESGNPMPIAYSQAQINAALTGGTPIAERDAVGHGTATAGTAASNGRALADKRYRGIAPGADLIIVKAVSDGAPAHGGQASEAPFVACIDDAIDWVAQKMDTLGQPGIVIINSGTQWGPMDGTSAVSRKLDATFGENRHGRIVVIPGGDEGSLPNHAGADFSSTAATIGISKASTDYAVMSAWYTGATPAQVTVKFDDGTTVGPINPGGSTNTNGIYIYNYAPGTEFYPWTSNSGDRVVYIGVSGHATTGSVSLRATAGGSGHVDLYGDVIGPNLTPVTSMTDHLVPGRLEDYATTYSAIVSGNHVIRTQYTDIDGIARNINTEGSAGAIWLKSSPGPTRDGRLYGVDVTAPGQNLFASVGPNSYWGSFRGNLPQGSNGYYVRFGGNSGAAPIIVGAIALMLQANPSLTAHQARRILHASARSDGFTGAVPNTTWGHGKLDVYAAVQGALDTIYADGFDR